MLEILQLKELKRMGVSSGIRFRERHIGATAVGYGQLHSLFILVCIASSLLDSRNTHLVHSM